MSKTVDGNLPVHIAIIMDGNGRWAKKRHLPRILGHKAGIESVREIVRTSREIGIKYLSLFAFSTENWQRPKTEVNALMHLLKQYLRKELKELKENEIKLRVSGDVSVLPKDVRKEIENTLNQTSSCDKMVLNLCLNYGSRQEIIHAVNELSSEKKYPVTENNISANLYTANIPDPDLLIRTSGEFRISNFMLWQLAYTELYFTPVLWPDFREKHFLEAVESYKKRNRRFGRI